jgi:hypothetical protein
MAGHFEPLRGGGAAVTLDEVELSILRSLAVQLVELIGPGEEPDEGGDPLDALFAEGPSEPPSDEALQRLFPDAYGDDDDELRGFSAEFRRFTENDLRDRKRTDALAVVHTLDGLSEAGGVLRLNPDGTRLEVTDEDEGGELYRLPDSDPRKPMVMAYLWLGALQETLIETLM